MDPTNRAVENGPSVAPPVPPELETGHDGNMALAALRVRGAHRLDPSRFRYLEALARRASLHHGALRTLLEQRLAQALSAYDARYEAARSELDKAVPVLAQQYPQAAQALNQLHTDGDVRAVHLLAARLAAQSCSGPLSDLLRHIDGQTTTGAPVDAKMDDAATPSDTTAPMAELKTVQRFRETWNRLRVDDQLTRSQEKIPENPGPLNSHLLVLRALRRMQDISPAYLERFMAHVDGLLWLEHAGLRGPAPAGKAGGAGGKPAQGKGSGRQVRLREPE